MALINDQPTLIFCWRDLKMGAVPSSAMSALGNHDIYVISAMPAWGSKVTYITSAMPALRSQVIYVAFRYFPASASEVDHTNSDFGTFWPWLQESTRWNPEAYISAYSVLGCLQTLIKMIYKRIDFSIFCLGSKKSTKWAPRAAISIFMGRGCLP